MKLLDMLAWILLMIGGLNWGLTVFHFNIVDAIFTAGSTAATVVYALIGLSAVYGICRWRCCKSSCKM